MQNDKGVYNCTYKCPCDMTSDDHKELKIMKNDIENNFLLLYVQIN